MKHIILIGFMGSGKSTVGPLLADELSLKYVDTDQLIEDEEDMSISDIFSVLGEGYFRLKERRALEGILKREPCVVSTGGGSILDPVNVCLMRESGNVIYLKADIDILYERIKGCTTRPLVCGDDAYQKVSAIFSKRKSLYEDVAHFVVDTSDLKVDEVVREVLRVIRSEVGQF